MLNSSQNVAASIMCFYTATPLATDGQQNRRRRACRGAQARPSGKQPSETRSGESAAAAVWRVPRAVRSTWTYAGPRSSGASGFGDFCRNKSHSRPKGVKYLLSPYSRLKAGTDRLSPSPSREEEIRGSRLQSAFNYRGHSPLPRVIKRRADTIPAASKCPPWPPAPSELPLHPHLEHAPGYR